MTPIDDLKIGDWIAVCGYHGPTIQNPWGEYNPHFDWDGLPHKIIAISLPFIAVSNGQDIKSLDMRRFYVKRLSKRYVDVLRNRSREDAMLHVESKKEKKQKKRYKEREDKQKCPRCGCKFVQRLIEPGTGRWKLYCPGCDFTGGVVEDE